MAQRGRFKGYEETSQTERIIEDGRGAKAFERCADVDSRYHILVDIAADRHAKAIGGGVVPGPACVARLIGTSEVDRRSNLVSIQSDEDSKFPGRLCSDLESMAWLYDESFLGGSRCLWRNRMVFPFD